MEGATSVGSILFHKIDTDNKSVIITSEQIATQCTNGECGSHTLVARDMTRRLSTPNDQLEKMFSVVKVFELAKTRVA